MHEPELPALHALSDYDRMELIAFASKADSEDFHYAYENWPPSFETDQMKRLAADRSRLESLLDARDAEILAWWDNTPNPVAALDDHHEQARQRAEAHLLWAVRPVGDTVARAYLQAFATNEDARQWLAARAELQKQNPAAWSTTGWQLLHRDQTGGPWSETTATPGPSDGHRLAEQLRADGWEVAIRRIESGLDVFTIQATMAETTRRTVLVTWTSDDQGATWRVQTVHADPGIRIGGRGPLRKRPSLPELIAALTQDAAPAAKARTRRRRKPGTTPAGPGPIELPEAGPTCIDLDAGPGTRALGLEDAGFTILAVSAVQPEDDATIGGSRRAWRRIHASTGAAAEQLPDLGVTGISLLSARLPVPAGYGDSRGLDPIARAAAVLNPEAILLEGVPAYVVSTSVNFTAPRARLTERLARLGYEIGWQVLDGADYSTPTGYRRAIAVALRSGRAAAFTWPSPGERATVGDALRPTWAARGLADQADAIAERANGTGPQIVLPPRRCAGAPYLGPAPAAAAWRRAGLAVAFDPDGSPAALDGPSGIRLTPAQLAALKAIPSDWDLDPDHLNRLYQAERAFPPAFATALGRAIAQALTPAG